MSMRTAKLMALYPHKGNFRAPNIAYPFYFHTPAPYEVNTGDALTSENNVVSIGGIVSPSGRGLQTVSWQGQFLVSDYELFHGGDLNVNRFPSFVMSPPNSHFKFDDAFDSIKLLNAMKELNQIAILQIQDRVLGRGDDINMNVICKSFTWNEKEGEPDVRYYSVTFQEYRALTIRKVPPSGAPVPGTNPRPDKYGRFLPATYKVPAEQGLAYINKLAYHNKAGSRTLRRIIKANGGQTWLTKLLKQHKAEHKPKVRWGPWFIKAGVKIYIPPVNGKLHPTKPKPHGKSSFSADED